MTGALLKFLVLWCMPVFALAEDSAIANLFAEARIDGTLVMESSRTGQRFVHNDARSKLAFSPASTFKVLNTLIALEEGVIDGADSDIPWDGAVHEIADWNRDQTLESAFKVSCVWCYQALAKRVGALIYPDYIRRSHYGDLREPFEGTEFWLDGSLTLSAEQQVAFLKQVVHKELPFRASSYATLKTVMLTEKAPHYQLFAKTGWATRRAPAVGWYVGYVEVADDTWFFALNMETRSPADLPLRKDVTLAALRAKGIL